MQEEKEKTKVIPEEQINSVSNLFSVLSHPVRIKILWLLKKKKQVSVHELQKELNISQSNVSQHLALLRTHKLVTEERKGKEVFYSLVASKKISKVLASAVSLIAYQLTSNSELLSTYNELLSFLG
ncbi:MAG: helix-turn-helix transcriptional regulator [Candidatus Melainabacteria bacterium]|nr:helix-turn-helix transcriptional regulator [Candidatus Melainabacteria bacterium]